MARVQDPMTFRGCLQHAGGPLLVLWGGAWLGVGTWQLLAGAPRLSGTVAAIFSGAGLVLTLFGVRLLVRAATGGVARAPGAAADTSFADVALGDGRSATARVIDDDLVIETMRVRAWAGGVTAIAVGAYVASALQTLGGGGGPPMAPGRIWLVLALGIVAGRFQRKHVVRYPLDAFSAVAVDDAVVTLHRRGGERPPLALAAKSWHVSRLVDALRERIPAAFEADAPQQAAYGRDEGEDLRRAVAEWVPEGRRAVSTGLGAAFVAVSLLLGAFEMSGVLPRPMLAPRWFALAAVVVWLEDAASTRYRQHQAERVHGKAVKPLTVATRRARGDILAWLLPWQRTTVHVHQDRLVLRHSSVDLLDSALLVGVACIGGWVVLGGITPLHAGGFLLGLLASGYPRRRADPETFDPSDVVAMHDAGSRATLTVRDDDGPRDVLLRFDSGQGRRLTALVRETCPEADVREPGWRRNG